MVGSTGSDDEELPEKLTTLTSACSSLLDFKKRFSLSDDATLPLRLSISPDSSYCSQSHAPTEQQNWDGPTTWANEKIEVQDASESTIKASWIGKDPFTEDWTRQQPEPRDKYCQAYSVNDIFGMDFPSNILADHAQHPAQAPSSNPSTHFSAARKDSLASACLQAASGGRPARALEVEESLPSVEIGSSADCAQEQCNYFWDQSMTVNSPHGSSEALPDFVSQACKKDVTSSTPLEHPPLSSSRPSAHTQLLWASSTLDVEPLSTQVQHTMRAGDGGGSKCAGKIGGTRPQKKHRCRTNKKPLYWTAEDHKKFVAGLEQFGLQDGLGPSGAELMSVYMGNRSVLQIKSHMQKHLSDLAGGKAAASSAPRSASRSVQASSSPCSRFFNNDTV